MPVVVIQLFAIAIIPLHPNNNNNLFTFSIHEYTIHAEIRNIMQKFDIVLLTYNYAEVRRPLKHLLFLLRMWSLNDSIS